jgi:hypothetical protein
MSSQFNLHTNIIDVVACSAALVKLIATISALLEASAAIHQITDDAVVRQAVIQQAASNVGVKPDVIYNQVTSNVDVKTASNVGVKVDIVVVWKSVVDIVRQADVV